MQSVQAFGQLENAPQPKASNITQHRVSNAVKHETFLKEDQIEFKKVMNREQHSQRQQELVYEQGPDDAEEATN